MRVNPDLELSMGDESTKWPILIKGGPHILIYSAYAATYTRTFFIIMIPLGLIHAHLIIPSVAPTLKKEMFEDILSLLVCISKEWNSILGPTYWSLQTTHLHFTLIRIDPTIYWHPLIPNLWGPTSVHSYHGPLSMQMSTFWYRGPLSMQPT